MIKSKKNDLELLKKRIQKLEKSMSVLLYKETEEAVDCAQNNYLDASAIKVANVVEGLLSSIYEFKMKEHGKEPEHHKTIQELKIALSKELRISIPKPVEKKIELIQTLRNEFVAHYNKNEKLQYEDLETMLSLLVGIIEWYITSFDDITLEQKKIFPLEKQKKKLSWIKKCVISMSVILISIIFVFWINQQFALYYKFSNTFKKLTSHQKEIVILDGDHPEEIMKYLGKEMIVKGKIVSSKKTDNAIFLNFGLNWQKSFTLVILNSEFDNFKIVGEPMEYYYEKEVIVTGVIKEYKNKPEIILSTPSQIKIIK